MMENLWTIDAIAKAVAGNLVRQNSGEGGVGSSAAVTGVSIDSRSLEKGDLFIALKGEQADGHDYLAKAFDKGAAAALVSDLNAAETAISGPCIKVDDTFRALEHLGTAARDRTQARVVAITGSAGKTSTTRALKRALEPYGETHSSVKSYNNMFGVPLSLARMPSTTKFGIFEIGMNHAGEITPLSNMVRPDVAVITNVEPVHIGHFENIEGIAHAKAEIFSGLSPTGTAILNRDNAQFPLLKSLAQEQGVNIMTFGESPQADCQLVAMEPAAESTEVTLQVSVGGQNVERHSYRIGAPGKHLVLNSLAVAAVVHSLGLPMAAALATFAAYEIPEGRGVRQNLRCGDGWITLIDESYNANPVSMRAALATVFQIPAANQQRRIAVLGDMLELGRHSIDYHRELKVPLEEAEVDLVFACGPDMSHLYQDLDFPMRGGYGATAEELSPLLVAALRAGDIVMLKGSLGSRVGSIVKAVVERYPVATEKEKKTED